MKKAQAVAGALLGALFVVFGFNFFFPFLPMPPPPPPDTPVGMFMGATFATGFLAYVKAFEMLGGLLVAIPRTRPAGLLILVPIVLNIVAFHVFIAGGGLLEPMLLAVIGLTAFLSVSHRQNLAALLRTP